MILYLLFDMLAILDSSSYWQCFSCTLTKWSIKFLKLIVLTWRRLSSYCCEFLVLWVGNSWILQFLKWNGSNKIHLRSVTGRRWATWFTHSNLLRKVWKASLCGKSINKPYRVWTMGPFFSGSKSSIRRSEKKYI